MREVISVKYPCDLHTHSIASGHGTSDTIFCMAGAAGRKGITLLGISDHGPATCAAAKPSYFRSLAHAPRRRCGIEVLYGAEVSIVDPEGNVDLPDDVLACLDYVIISMHPHILTPGNAADNTRAFLLAMRHPKVKIIGHPDDPRFPLDYETLVRAAAENHIFPEINNCSLDPAGYRGDTRENIRTLLEYCGRFRTPVILSSDAHGAGGIGDFAFAEAMLSETGFPAELVAGSDPEALRREITGQKTR